MQVPFLPLSSAVTVIVATPPLIATRWPLSSTNTVLGSELSIVYALFVASAGRTLTVRSASLPFLISSEDILKPMEVTCCFTVTVQVAVKPPSVVLTVIFAVPAFTGVILPLVETFTTEVSELDHLTP